MKNLMMKLCFWVLSKFYKPDVDALIGRVDRAAELALDKAKQVELTDIQIKEFKANIFHSTQAGIDATTQIGLDYDNVIFDSYIENLVSLGIAREMAFLSKKDYHKTIVRLGEVRTKMTRKLWEIIQDKLLVVVLGELKPGNLSDLLPPITGGDGYSWPDTTADQEMEPENQAEFDDIMDEVNKALGLKNNKGNLPH